MIAILVLLYPRLNDETSVCEEEEEEENGSGEGDLCIEYAKKSNSF